jgi:hypothetical protein
MLKTRFQKLLSAIPLRIGIAVAIVVGLLIVIASCAPADETSKARLLSLKPQMRATVSLK